METEIDIEKPEQGNQEEDMRDREMPEKEAECIYQPTLGINMHATHTDTYHARTRTIRYLRIPPARLVNIPCHDRQA